MRPLTIRAIIAALCVVSLSACIDSSGPILSDAPPVLGPKLQLQLFTLHRGVASEPQQASYTWNGKLYVHAGGGMGDISAFSVHPFEAGDFIVQDIPTKSPHISEYGLMRQLTGGVYLVRAIDENDADEATRAANCGKGEKANPSSCRISTREQLFAFARAAAAKRHDDGGLVIRLDDEPPQ